MLLENDFWERFHDFIAEAAKAFLPYFEVPYVPYPGFVKRPCDADLVFCSWVLDLRMNALEKNEEDSQINNVCR